MDSTSKDVKDIKISGALAAQVNDLKKKLNLNSEVEVIKWGLSLLYYAIGAEIKIERKDKNQVLVFDQFKDKGK